MFYQIFDDYRFQSEKQFNDLNKFDLVTICFNMGSFYNYVGNIYYKDYLNFRVELTKLFKSLIKGRGYSANLSDFYFHSDVFIKLFKENGGFYNYGYSDYFKRYLKNKREKLNQ